MRILGALLAGGESRRFGSDKASAQYQSKSLIDHGLQALSRQCDHIAICGREYQNFTYLVDLPMSGQGPLGGINAALFHASENGYDAVISFPCDTICLPAFINKAWFACDASPQYINTQPVIGYWPSPLSAPLNHWMTSQKRRSVMAWIDHIKAMSIERDHFRNINTPLDLDDLPS